MNCPKCMQKALCIDSRPMLRGSRWRKYRCPECGDIIETMERIINIRKGDNREKVVGR